MSTPSFAPASRTPTFGEHSTRGTLSAAAIVFLIGAVLLAFNRGFDSAWLAMVIGIYCVGFWLVADLFRYWRFPGIFALAAASSIRYLVLPVLLLLFTDPMHQAVTTTAWLVFLSEEVAWVTCATIVTRVWYPKMTQHSAARRDDYMYWPFWILGLAGAVVVLREPAILNQFNTVFVSLSDYDVIKARELVTGVSGMLVDWAKLILPALICVPLVAWGRRTENSAPYWLVLIIMVCSNTLVFSGSSRNSMLVPSVAALFFILWAFPTRQRTTMILLVPAVTCALLLVTLLKTGYVGTYLTTLGDLTDYLQAYFAGPRSVQMSVDATHMFGNSFTLDTRLTDLFGNVPGLAGGMDLENRTSTFYNLFAYSGAANRDQIIPLVGQGLFHFGAALCVLPVPIVIAGMCAFDRWYARTEACVTSFLAAVFAVRFGMGMMANLSILSGFLFGTALPLAFLASASRLVLRRRDHHHEIDASEIVPAARPQADVP